MGVGVSESYKEILFGNRIFKGKKMERRQISSMFCIGLLIAYSIVNSDPAFSSESILMEQVLKRQQLVCQLTSKAIFLISENYGIGELAQYPNLNKTNKLCSNDMRAFAPEHGQTVHDDIEVKLRNLDKQIEILKKLIASLESEERDIS